MDPQSGSPTKLPDGGQLVYGKGGQDPKYIRDSNARNSNDYQLDYALATQGSAQPAPQMQQQWNPGLASQQGYGGMPMAGSNGSPIQAPPMQQQAQQGQQPMQQFQQPSQQQFQQPSQQPAPQSFQQFRQAMQPQQGGQQQPNIAQQLMQQQAMQQAQHQQAQHKGAMVNALLGLGAAGIGMIGGAEEQVLQAELHKPWRKERSYKHSIRQQQVQTVA